MSNGIYLTEQGKLTIEAKITELKKPYAHYDGIYVSDAQSAQIDLLEEMLETAIVLPIYQSLGHAMQHMDLDKQEGAIINPKN